MKDYFGPYVRIPETDKWHWNEKCPKYPKGKRIESMVTSMNLTSIEMCAHCAKLDVNAYDMAEKNKIISNIHHLTDRQLSNNRMINEDIRKENLAIDHIDHRNKKQA